jgi:hypothetical protein
LAKTIEALSPVMPTVTVDSRAKDAMDARTAQATRVVREEPA